MLHLRRFEFVQSLLSVGALGVYTMGQNNDHATVHLGSSPRIRVSTRGLEIGSTFGALFPFRSCGYFIGRRFGLERFASILQK